MKELKEFGFSKTPAAQQLAGAIALKWHSLQDVLGLNGFDFAAAVPAAAVAAVTTAAKR